MNTKRILSILLTVCTICSFTACGKTEGNSGASAPDRSDISGGVSTVASLSSDTVSLEGTESGMDSSSKAGNSTVSTNSKPGKTDITSSKNTGGNQVVIDKSGEIKESDIPIEKGLNFGGKTLKLAVGYTTTSSFAAMVKAFESTYNCKIEITQLSFDKYLADLAAKVTSGEVFDIVYVHGSFYPNSFIKGFFQPLDGVFTTADLYDVKNLAAGGIDKVKSEGFAWNGHYYAVTGYQTSVPMLYYNKKMMVAAGYTGKKDPLALYESGEWSYQKLEEIGKQVTNASAGIYLGGRDFFAGGLVAFNRGQFVKMNGTTVSENLSDPRIYNAYKFQRDISLGSGAIINYKTGTGGQDYSAFAKGKTYMFYNDSSMYSTLAKAAAESGYFGKNKSNLGYVPFPYGPDNTKKEYFIKWLEGWGAGINCKDKRAAVAFTKFESKWKDGAKTKYSAPDEFNSLVDKLLTGNVFWNIGGFAGKSTYVPGLQDEVCAELTDPNNDLAATLEKYRNKISSCLAECLQGK